MQQPTISKLPRNNLLHSFIMQMFIALIVFTNTIDRIINKKLYLFKHNEEKLKNDHKSKMKKIWKLSCHKK